MVEFTNTLGENIRELLSRDTLPVGAEAAKVSMALMYARSLKDGKLKGMGTPFAAGRWFYASDGTGRERFEYRFGRFDFATLAFDPSTLDSVSLEFDGHRVWSAGSGLSRIAQTDIAERRPQYLREKKLESWAYPYNGLEFPVSIEESARIHVGELSKLETSRSVVLEEGASRYRLSDQVELEILYHTSGLPIEWVWTHSSKDLPRLRMRGLISEWRTLEPGFSVPIEFQVTRQVGEEVLYEALFRVRDIKIGPSAQEVAPLQVPEADRVTVLNADTGEEYTRPGRKPRPASE